MKAISIPSIGALAAIVAGCLNTEHSASATVERYPWKKNIVTTVFWIGEQPSGNNPVPNRRSSWDKIGPGITADLTTQIPRIAAITFR